MNEWGDHRHYYADPSGGFGWPSCVICGKAAGSDDDPAPPRYTGILVCCGQREDAGHTPACSSMDAVAKRRAARDG